MSSPLLLSVVESPSHPDFSGLYRQLGFQELRVTAMRKAIASLKKAPPAVVVAEFFYGYGNNYAGVNVSNLDVFLSSLQKYAPRARVIVLLDKSQAPYLGKLQALFTVHEALLQPVSEAQMEAALSGVDG